MEINSYAGGLSLYTPEAVKCILWDTVLQNRLHFFLIEIESFEKTILKKKLFLKDDYEFFTHS